MMLNSGTVVYPVMLREGFSFSVRDGVHRNLKLLQHTLPPGTMSDSYELRDLDHAYVGHLYEGKLVIDKTYGHAAYGCGNCRGYNPLYFGTDPFGGPPDLNLTETIDSLEACGGGIVDVTGIGYDWKSNNAAVATLPNKVLHTVAAGSTTGQADFKLEAEHPAPQCPTYVYGPAQSVNVGPVITGSGNSVWWFNGQNPNSTSYPLSVTLSSSAGASTSWAVGQKDAKVKLSSTSGQQITVTSTGTNFSSQVGDISITATDTTNGASSNPFYMSARTPWKLVLSSQPTYCYGSPQTYGTYMTYDVVDNLSNTMSSNIYWNESVGSASCDNGSNWCNTQIQTGPGDTGPLQDILDPPNLNANPVPNPTPTCSGQANGATRYRSIPQVIYVGSDVTGQGVKAQSDLLGYYIDHGQHDSIQSPSQPPQ
jgi:hypothetical protein